MQRPDVDPEAEGFAGQLDLLEQARRERDEALVVAETSTHPGWRLVVQRCIQELAASGEPFTADDVRRVAGDPLASSPNALGAALSGACRRGVIRPVGFVQSTRPERHGAWVREWIGTGDAS